MKFNYSICLIFLCSQINAQTIEKKIDYTWTECKPNAARFYTIILKTDSGYVRNDYYIHEKTLQMTGKFEDPDCKIHDGQFYFYHPKKVIETVGKYFMGKKKDYGCNFIIREH